MHAKVNQLAGSQQLHLEWGIYEVPTWSGGELPENCEKMEQALRISHLGSKLCHTECAKYWDWGLGHLLK